MALSEAKLRSLKLCTKVYTEPDEKGLYVEVFLTGGIVWRYRYRLGEKQEKLTLGRWPDLGLKDVRRLHLEARQQVAFGESPARGKQSAKRKDAGAGTLRDFAECYFRDVQTKERKDYMIPRRYLDKDILPALGHKRLDEITTADIREVIIRKKDQGFDAAANQIRGLLKRLFDYAIDRGLVTQNPVSALPARRVFKAKARDRALSPAELGEALKLVFESNMRRQLKLAYHLLLLTLVRKSELFNARWQEVDLDQAEWHIPPDRSKNNKPHIVYLSK